MLILFLSIFTLSDFLFSQEASISASVDKRLINSNEELTLTINIKVSSGDTPQPEIPEMIDFEITGRYTSSSQSMIFTNGRLERSVSKIYTLTLFPLKAGKITIPRIQIRKDGQVYKTDPIQIEVVNGQMPSKRSVVPKEDPFQSVRTGNVMDAFLKSSSDKSDVYVGEQFLFTLGLYRLTSLQTLQGQFSKLPQFSGFRKTDLEPSDKRILINGRYYDVREWQFSLIPVTSGEYTIEEAVLPCQTDDFARSFFNRGKPRRFRLESDPVTIKVLPLPQMGKPGTFSGAVGEYTISSFVDKKSVKVNEAISLKVELSGRGDLTSAKDPVIIEPPEFSMYKSKCETDSKVSGNTLHTHSTYEFVLVPEKAGQYLLEPVSFSFFDTSLKKYRTIKSGAISLSVAPGKKKAAANDTLFIKTGQSKKDVRLIKSDINFIKPDAKILKNYKSKFMNPLILSINIFPLFLFLGSIIFKRRLTKLHDDVGYARSLRAEKLSRKRLKESSKYLEADPDNLFPINISNAITEFIADKLNISGKGLTINKIETKLDELNLPKENITRVVDVINECDLFRFSTISSTKEQRENIYEQSRDIMVTLERQFTNLEKNTKKR